jgi:hypothetical protein
MRANAGFDCFPTTRSRRNAGACSSGGTLERTTHRVVERATAAAPTVLGLRCQTLHGGHMRDPTENLSRNGRVSHLLNSQCLLTPFLDRAASQQQKQHPGDRHNQQLPGCQAAQHAQGGGRPKGGGRRKPRITPTDTPSGVTSRERSSHCALPQEADPSRGPRREMASGTEMRVVSRVFRRAVERRFAGEGEASSHEFAGRRSRRRRA